MVNFWFINVLFVYNNFVIWFIFIGIVGKDFKYLNFDVFIVKICVFLILL